MTMNFIERMLTIAICAVGTMATRFLPFLVFRPDKETPKYIQYLGKALPAAIFGMLVVYCLKNVSFVSGSYAVPEMLAILLTIILHLWKRQMLLSIAGGTVGYMLLIHFL